jgi:hypothetical protein
VPGIIESPDLPEGGGGQSSWSFIEATGPVPEPSPDDIEDFADRLRFMGLDEVVVVEFEQRAAADYWAAQRWVQEWLAALPHAPVWECECGEALVPDDWKGRATIRCDVCGRRWGLDAHEGGGGQLWGVSGPSNEWSASHHEESGDPYGTWPPEVVIANGLPPMVSEIEPGTGFPLATFVSGDWAAVLYGVRNRLSKFDLPGDEYEYEIEHLRRESGDEWVGSGSGGGGWVNPFAPPQALLAKYAMLGTGTSSPCVDDDCICLTGGICSSAVAAVELIEGDTTTQIPIDATRPVFLVATSAPSAVVRLLDHSGTPVRDHRSNLLEFELGTADRPRHRPLPDDEERQ